MKTTMKTTTKKKVLTTAMALAMLTPTMTSFASSVTGSQTIGGEDTNISSGQISVNGQVRKADGTAAAGRIEVTLPTSVSFVVDQEGKVQTPTNITVTNNSQVPVDVSIANFTDSTPKEGVGITLVPDASGLENKGRNYVNLVLSGNDGNSVVLEHDNTTVGTILTLGDTTTGSNTANLVLSGTAGSKTNDDSTLENNGTNDTFTITFHVSKQ